MQGNRKSERVGVQHDAEQERDVTIEHDVTPNSSPAVAQEKPQRDVTGGSGEEKQRTGELAGRKNEDSRQNHRCVVFLLIINKK